MNLVFGALLLFLFLVPGFVFRLSFLKSDSLKSNVDTTTIAELLFASFFAGWIHSVSVIFINGFFWLSGINLRINLNQAYLLLFGAKQNDGLFIRVVLV